MEVREIVEAIVYAAMGDSQKTAIVAGEYADDILSALGQHGFYGKLAAKSCAERDALQWQIDGLTSDAAVEAFINSSGYAMRYPNRDVIKAAITAAIEAAKDA